MQIFFYGLFSLIMPFFGSLIEKKITKLNQTISKLLDKRVQLFYYLFGNSFLLYYVMLFVYKC